MNKMVEKHPFVKLVNEVKRIYCLNDSVFIPSKSIYGFSSDTFTPCDTRQFFEEQYFEKNKLQTQTVSDIDELFTRVKNRYFYGTKTCTNEQQQTIQVQSPLQKKNVLFEITPTTTVEYIMVAPKKPDVLNPKSIDLDYRNIGVKSKLGQITSYKHKSLQLNHTFDTTYSFISQIPKFACEIDNMFYLFEAVKIQTDVSIQNQNVSIIKEPRVIHSKDYAHFFVWNGSNLICFGDSLKRWNAKNIPFHKQYDIQDSFIANKIAETILEAEYVLHNGYSNKELKPVRNLGNESLVTTQIAPTNREIYKNIRL